MSAHEVIYQLRREVTEKELLIEKLEKEIESLKQVNAKLIENLNKKVDKSLKVNF